MKLPEIIVVDTHNRQSELQQQENQIIGKLYRDMIAFEGTQDNDKTWHQIDRVVNQARQECQYIGSDGEFLEGFIKRLNISNTTTVIRYDNYKE